MTGWLSDPTILLTVLGLLALGFGLAWWNSRKGGYALGFALALAAILLIGIFSWMADSDARKIERAIRDMGDGVEKGDVNRIFSHVADGFQSGGMSKTAFRGYAERFIERHHPQSISVWDFEARELSPKERRATVTFKVKGQGIEEREGVSFYNVRAVFVLEPDQEWRMQDFRLFAPMTDPMRGDPLALPGFGR
jgi:hypothetical protein